MAKTYKVTQEARQMVREAALSSNAVRTLSTSASNLTQVIGQIRKLTTTGFDERDITAVVQQLTRESELLRKLKPGK